MTGSVDVPTGSLRFPVAPEIVTERLLLRAHRREDFNALAEMWADEDVVRFITGHPSTRKDSWSRFLRFGGHWQMMGYGAWAVEERESGAYLGNLGFAEFMRDMSPPIEGIPEAGWVLMPWAQGKGFALEAMLAALKWGDENLPGDRTVALFDPEHRRSIRLAEKCGYVQSHMTTPGDEPTLVMERRRPG